MFKQFLLYIILFFALLSSTYGQCDTCDYTTTIYVDLSSNPDSVWTNDTLSRAGKCCTAANTACIRFYVTVHPTTNLLNFDFAGASAGQYVVNCTDYYGVKDTLCVSGTGPHCIVYCKPGNNANTYTISATHTVEASRDITINGGCSAEISVQGLDESSIVWNTVYPGNKGDYNNFLSDTADSDTISITPINPFPAYIDIEVTGTHEAFCTSLNTRDTVRVNFTNDMTAAISPAGAAICFGGSGADLTATGGGGAPPYSYLWSTGETTQTITVNSAGTYWVAISDTGDCPPVYDTVTVIEHTADISVEAGSNQTICTSSGIINLAGSVDQATGGTWSGGAGGYAPDADSLSTTYTATAGEIASGSMKLYLTSTGNGGCPPETDSISITFADPPVANAGSDEETCSNVNFDFSTAATQPTASNYDSLLWTTTGTGYFNDSTLLLPTYTPGAGESGTITFSLTAFGSGSCTDSTDNMSLAITTVPTVNAGSDEETCSGFNFDFSSSTTQPTASNYDSLLWTTTGTGTFNNNTALLPIYTTGTGETGTITFILKAFGSGSCSEITDSMSLIVTAIPIANTGSDEEICSNVNFDFSTSATQPTASNYDSLLWTTTGTGYFNDSTLLLPVYTPDSGENGAITFTLKAYGSGSCGDVTSDMTLTITPAPIIEAGSNEEVCYTNSFDFSTSTITPSITNPDSITWSSAGAGSFNNTADTQPLYTPAGADSGNIKMILNVTGNGSCATVKDSFLLFVTPLPVSYAGSNKAICENNSYLIPDAFAKNYNNVSWSTTGDGIFANGATLTPTYTPGSGDKASGNTNLVLTTNSIGSCPAAKDTLTLTVNTIPSVDAGTNKTVCSNKSAVALSGSVNNASGIVWSGGDGTFSPDSTNINATYIPGTNDIATGFVILVISSTGNGACSAASDFMSTTILQAPSVTLSGNDTVCANNANAAVSGFVLGVTTTKGKWSTTGSGSFSPNDSAISVTYIPHADDITAGNVQLKLQSTNDAYCNTVADSLTIAYTSAPTIEFGNDTTVCANNSDVPHTPTITVATGGQWSTSGSGTFSPDANIVNATYKPSTADTTSGTVTLTLTTTGNGSCQSVSKNKTVTITPAPYVLAGNDMNVCESSPVANLNGFIGGGASTGSWSGNGSGSFGNSTLLNTTYTLSAADITNGTIELYLTTTDHGDCNPVSDTLIITVNKIPVVNAGSDKTVCANNSLTALTGTVSNTTNYYWSKDGTGTFLSDSTLLNITYQPNNADTALGTVNFTLHASNACGTITDQAKLTITPAPNVEAGTNKMVCSNQTSVLLNGKVTEGAITGLWSTSGDGSFSPGATQLNSGYVIGEQDTINGEVTLYLTSTNNGNCNAETDSMVISIISSPDVNILAPDTVCTSSLINLNVTITGGSGTGIWTTPNGKGIISPNIETKSVVYTPHPDDIIQQEVTFIFTTTNNGSCLPAYDIKTVKFTTPPTVNAGSDITACENTSSVSLNGTIAGGASEGYWSTNGNGTFSPDSSSLTASYIPGSADTANGTVLLKLTISDGCDLLSDSLTLTFQQVPVLNAGTDIFACKGVTSVNLNGVISGSTTTGLWSTPGDGTFTPSTSTLNATYNLGTNDTTASGTTLILTSTNNGYCSAVSDTVLISLTTVPSVSAGSDTNICANGSIALSGTVLNGSGSGTWSTNGDGTFLPSPDSLNTVYYPGIIDTTNGTATLTLTSTDACVTATDDITLTILDAPSAYAGEDTILCEDNATITLNGTVTAWAQPGEWSTTGTGAFTPTINTLNATYTPSATDISSGLVKLALRSTNNGSCNASIDTITLTILKKPVANAGIDTTVCPNTPLQLNGSMVNGMGTGVWSTFNGTGSFSDSSLLTSEYYSSTDDVVSGTINLVLTSTNNGNCTASSDTLTLTMLPSPTAQAGGDQQICKNNSTVTLTGNSLHATGGLWSTLGTGSFTNSTNLNTTYTPSSNDLLNGQTKIILTTTGNGSCLADTDTMQINFFNAPVVSAATDKYICEGTSIVSISGSISGITSTGKWYTPASGAFSDSLLLNTIYYLGSDDTTRFPLILESTNNLNCVAVRDTTYINVTSVPLVNAGINDTVCANNASISLNGNISGGTSKGQWSILQGSGSFTPYDTTLNATYIPSLADTTNGNVKLILTATNACVPVRDTVEFIITPAPIVDSGNDILVCENSASIQLNGNVYAGSSTGVWKSLGNGNFDDSTLLAAKYFPDATDLSNGFVYLVLTSSNNGNCIAVTDTVRVGFGVLPEAGFTISKDTACINENILFSDTSIISDGTIDAWNWNINTDTFNTATKSYGFSSPGTKNITLVVTSNRGCMDTISRSLYITPGPNALFTSTPNCENKYTVFNNLSTDAVSYWWDLGNGDTSVLHTPTPLIYDTAGLYPVSLITTDTYGCTDTSNVNVEIYPTPQADFSIFNLCEGQNALFKDESIISGDVIISRTWDFGDGGTSPLTNPQHLFAVSDTVIITLIASTAHCPDTAIQTVAPFSKANFNVSKSSGCSPLKTDMLPDTLSNSSYLWDFGDGSTSSQTSPSHLFYNNTGSTKTFNVILTMESSTGCTGTDTNIITVYPAPIPNFTMDVTSVCSNDTIRFTNSSQYASTYVWNFGDNTATTSATSPNHPFINDSSKIVYYSVQLKTISTNGCIDSITQYATIYPLPNINIQVTPTTVCHLKDVVLSAPAGGKSYYWDYGDNTPPEFSSNETYHKYENYSNTDTNINIKLVYTSNLNCSDTSTKTIIIHPNPNPSFTVDSLYGCSPFTPQITNTSPGGIEFYWDFGNNTYDTTYAAITSPTPFYNNDSSYQKARIIKLSALSSDGCIADYSKTIIVYPKVTSTFTTDIDDGCTPLNSKFTNTSKNAKQYLWKFSDGGVSTNISPKHTFLNDEDYDTSYTVQLIATSDFNCKDTSIYDTIIVRSKPDGFFTLDKSGGCSPLDLTISNESQRAATSAWYFEGGDSIATNDKTVNYFYKNTTKFVQDYDITLITRSVYGCIDTTTEKVSIYPEITAAFNTDTAGCDPLELTFSSTSEDALYYDWRFGDGNNSTDENPIHTYSNLSKAVKKYNTVLTTYSEYLCKDDTAVTIYVYPNPNANFDLIDEDGCSPFTIELYDSTYGAKTYYWNYGNGTEAISDSFISTHQYINNLNVTQTYDVKLKVENEYACTDSISQTVTIYPEVNASFIHDTAGCSPHKVDFTNTSDNVLAYDWEFGDGGVSNLINPSHTFINESLSDTVFTVSLHAESHYGCFDDTISHIKVFGMPDPEFEVEPSFQIFPNATVDLNNVTPGNWNYLWQFGDDVTSDEIQPESYTYSKWGVFRVILTASSKTNPVCKDTVSHVIQIALGKPTAAFDSAFKGCAPLTVTFENHSLSAQNYKWQFGDGSTSDDENPTHTFVHPGEYIVQLKAISYLGSHEVSDTIIAYEKPNPYFIASPLEVTIPNPVEFMNLSDNSTRYYWEFGDGNSSKEKSPKHIYNVEGAYTIFLKAWSEDGCIDSITIPDAVIARYNCRLIFPNAFTPNPYAPSGGVYTENDDENLNDVFHPLWRDIREYKLEIFNRWGELMFVSNDINIGWDGYYKGNLAKQDMYIWKATARCIDGTKLSQKGTVMLVQ